MSDGKIVVGGLFAEEKMGADRGEEDSKEERKKGFLNLISEDDLKRKHYDTQDQLRKSKREKRFEQKRGIQISDLDRMMSAIVDPEKIAALKPSVSDIPQYVDLLNSNEAQQVYIGIIAFRKLLAKREDSPIQDIIDANVVPKLLTLLDYTALPQIQYESLWCLTNIATGTTEQTQCLTEKGCIPKFISLMNSEVDSIKEQATWALGNIAGENVEFRDLVLQHGILPVMLNYLMTVKKESLLRHGCWALSNLVRGNPPPDYSKVLQIFPVLGKIIRECEDKEALTDACWTLSYTEDQGGQKVRFVIENGLLPRLVSFLESPVLGIVLPSLRVIGCIITGNDEQTQIGIDAGIIRPLGQLLLSPKSNLRKEAAWALSNITAGNTSQIQQMFDENLIGKMIELSMTDNFEVRRECVWAISNATSGANNEQLMLLLSMNAHKGLCMILTSPEPRTLAIALEGIENLLKKSRAFSDQKYFEQVLEGIEESGGLAYIDKLQSHPNTHIYKKCVKIIEDYFGTEEESLHPDSLDSISIFNF